MAAQFKVNDLVWAKMKGYPHWPAKIGEPPKDVKVPNNKYYVFFYGTKQYAVIGASDLFPYLEYKEKFSKPCSRKGYAEAVWQIEEDPNLVISSKVHTPKGRRGREREKEMSQLSSPVATLMSTRTMTSAESPLSSRGRTPSKSTPTPQRQKTLTEMCRKVDKKKEEGEKDNSLLVKVKDTKSLEDEKEPLVEDTSKDLTRRDASQPTENESKMQQLEKPRTRSKRTVKCTALDVDVKGEKTVRSLRRTDKVLQELPQALLPVRQRRSRKSEISGALSSGGARNQSSSNTKERSPSSGLPDTANFIESSMVVDDASQKDTLILANNSSSKGPVDLADKVPSADPNPRISPYSTRLRSRGNSSTPVEGVVISPILSCNSSSQTHAFKKVKLESSPSFVNSDTEILGTCGKRLGKRGRGSSVTKDQLDTTETKVISPSHNLEISPNLSNSSQSTHSGRDVKLGRRNNRESVQTRSGLRERKVNSSKSVVLGSSEVKMVKTLTSPTKDVRVVVSPVTTSPCRRTPSSSGRGSSEQVSLVLSFPLRLLRNTPGRCTVPHEKTVAISTNTSAEIMDNKDLSTSVTQTAMSDQPNSVVVPDQSAVSHGKKGMTTKETKKLGSESQRARVRRGRPSELHDIKPKIGSRKKVKEFRLQDVPDGRLIEAEDPVVLQDSEITQVADPTVQEVEQLWCRRSEGDPQTPVLDAGSVGVRECSTPKLPVNQSSVVQQGARSMSRGGLLLHNLSPTSSNQASSIPSAPLVSTPVQPDHHHTLPNPMVGVGVRPGRGYMGRHHVMSSNKIGQVSYTNRRMDRNEVLLNPLCAPGFAPPMAPVFPPGPISSTPSSYVPVSHYSAYSSLPSTPMMPGDHMNIHPMHPGSLPYHQLSTPSTPNMPYRPNVGGCMSCPPSVGDMSVPFNPLPETASVEDVLSANNHSIFEFDSDIISLLDEVPDSIAWDTSVASSGTPVQTTPNLGYAGQRRSHSVDAGTVVPILPSRESSEPSTSGLSKKSNGNSAAKLNAESTESRNDSKLWNAPEDLATTASIDGASLDNLSREVNTGSLDDTLIPGSSDECRVATKESSCAEEETRGNLKFGGDVAGRLAVDAEMEKVRHELQKIKEAQRELELEVQQEDEVCTVTNEQMNIKDSVVESQHHSEMGSTVEPVDTHQKLQEIKPEKQDLIEEVEQSVDIRSVFGNETVLQDHDVAVAGSSPGSEEKLATEMDVKDKAGTEETSCTEVKLDDDGEGICGTKNGPDTEGEKDAECKPVVEEHKLPTADKDLVAENIPIAQVEPIEDKQVTEDKPVAEEDTVAVDDPISKNNPSMPKVEDEPVANEPFSESEPVTTDEPDAKDKPVADSEPVAEDESQAKDKPVADSEPVAEDESQAKDKPVADSEPVAEDESQAKDKPIADSEPVAEDESQAKDKPIAENEPVAEDGLETTYKPVAESEPVIQNELITHDQLAATNDPVIQDKPVATVEPVADIVEAESVAQDEGVTAHKVVATDKPISKDEPVAEVEPVTIDGPLTNNSPQTDTLKAGGQESQFIQEESAVAVKKPRKTRQARVYKGTPRSLRSSGKNIASNSSESSIAKLTTSNATAAAATTTVIEKNKISQVTSNIQEEPKIAITEDACSAQGGPGIPDSGVRDPIQDSPAVNVSIQDAPVVCGPSQDSPVQDNCAGHNPKQDCADSSAVSANKPTARKRVKRSADTDFVYSRCTRARTMSSSGNLTESQQDIDTSARRKLGVNAMQKSADKSNTGEEKLQNDASVSKVRETKTTPPVAGRKSPMEVGGNNECSVKKEIVEETNDVVADETSTSEQKGAIQSLIATSNPILDQPEVTEESPAIPDAPTRRKRARPKQETPKRPLRSSARKPHAKKLDHNVERPGTLVDVAKWVESVEKEMNASGFPDEELCTETVSKAADVELDICGTNLKVGELSSDGDDLDNIDDGEVADVGDESHEASMNVSEVDNIPIISKPSSESCGDMDIGDKFNIAAEVGNNRHRENTPNTSSSTLSNVEERGSCELEMEEEERADSAGDQHKNSSVVLDETASKENGEPNSSTGTLDESVPPPLLAIQEGMETIEILRIFNYNLKASLVIGKPNIQQALMTLQNLQQQHMVATDLEAVPDLVHTLRKLKRYQVDVKVMKKAAEVYSCVRELFLHPQVVPPPVKRKMLGPPRKMPPAVAEYANMMSNKKPGRATKAPRRLITKSLLKRSKAPPLKGKVAAPVKKFVVPKNSSKSESTSASDSKPFQTVPLQPVSGACLASDVGTSDVIDKQASVQTVSELSVPAVLQNTTSREKHRTSGARIKNADPSTRKDSPFNKSLHRRPLHTNLVGGNSPSEVSVPVTSIPEASADSNIPVQDQIVPSKLS